MVWALVGVAVCTSPRAGHTQTAEPQPSDLRPLPDVQSTVPQVVQALASHTLSPGEALDPTLDPAVRAAQLRHFRSAGFSLEIVPSAPVAMGTDGFASLQAAFRFHDGMMWKTRSNATLQFVERGDRWYFTDYNFLDVARFLTPGMMGSALVAVFLGGLLWLLLHRSRVRFAGSRPGHGEETTMRRDQMTGEQVNTDRQAGWRPELQPAHPQTVAYPEAPPAYEAPAGRSRQGAMPELAEAAHPQTTAYPKAPARYEERPKG